MEDYFLAMDDLDEPCRSAARTVTVPVLDALGAMYATPAEGTAFYILQSCANHSCAPNAHTLKVLWLSHSSLSVSCRCVWERSCVPLCVGTLCVGTLIRTLAQGEGDVDGAAVLTAKRSIGASEEITICYIDEDAALADRQEALRDYGFNMLLPSLRGRAVSEAAAVDRCKEHVTSVTQMTHVATLRLA